jgi:hypothetical protein
VTRQLALTDIADLREYERGREEFRAEIIEMKKRRRIPVGPHCTLLFENRETILFQIQEMARVEKLITDEAINDQLRAYNPLIPEPGMLSATLFIELTTEAMLREWLPKLVGIEKHLVFLLPDGHVVRCHVDPAHGEQLTREDMTAAVHYINWTFEDHEIDALLGGGAQVAIDHPAYQHSTALTDVNLLEFERDLRG